MLFWAENKKRVSALLDTHELQLPALLSTANINIIIDNNSENVNIEDKNNPKYSRKSPAASEGDIIKARGNLTTDKIFTKAEAKKIIAEIEERLVFVEKGMVGTVKGTNELIDQLWKGLNKANKGKYIGVGVKIADCVINHTVVEDIYEAIDSNNYGRSSDYKVVLTYDELINKWYLEVKDNNERNHASVYESIDEYESTREKYQGNNGIAMEQRARNG